MEHYYQPKIECASREQIRAWQDERLAKTVKRVYENVEFYRKKMDEAGVVPGDIQSLDDLHKLEPQGAGWSRFIPSMILTCGRNAVQGPLWRQAEPMRMWSMSVTGMGCLRVDRG